MFFKRGQSVENLKGCITTRLPSTDRIREKIRILIVDDNDVPYIEALKSLSFNVTYKKDIDNIMDVEPYAIIICDIKGVGKKFSEEQEGAMIIKTIKKMYPEKGVIAYSGGTFDISLFPAFSDADDTIQKGSDTSDIVDKLDNTIDKILDPTRLWREIEDRLRKSGADYKIINKAKKEYAKSITEYNASYISDYIKKHINNIGVRDILSAVFALIQIYQGIAN